MLNGGVTALDQLEYNLLSNCHVFYGTLIPTIKNFHLEEFIYLLCSALYKGIMIFDGKKRRNLDFQLSL